MSPIIHDVTVNFPIEAIEIGNGYLNLLVMAKEEIYYDYRAPTSTQELYCENMRMLQQHSYKRLLKQYRKKNGRDGPLMLELALWYVSQSTLMSLLHTLFHSGKYRHTASAKWEDIVNDSGFRMCSGLAWNTWYDCG